MEIRALRSMAALAMFTAAIFERYKARCETFRLKHQPAGAGPMFNIEGSRSLAKTSGPQPQDAFQRIVSNSVRVQTRFGLIFQAIITLGKKLFPSVVHSISIALGVERLLNSAN